MSSQRHIISDAIILKTYNSGEINRNFMFISPTLGIQNATAYGALKYKSRFCSSVQSFVKAKLYLYKSPKSAYYKLEDIADIYPNEFIKKNLSNIYLTSFFSEVLINTYSNHDDYKSYYFLILYSLEIIKEKKDIFNAFLFFANKFIFLSGYNFNFDYCKKCKKKYDCYFFDFNAGGIFCADHARKKIFKISNECLAFWKDFLIKKYIYLKNKKIEKKEFKILFVIIIDILKHIFENELNTFKYLTKIFK